MKTLAIILIVLCVSAVGVVVYQKFLNHKELTPSPSVYQGPVPEGYDEDHFRETGETIKLEENLE